MTKKELTKLRAVISAIAFLVLIVYFIWPFTLDPVVIVLICIIILPWLTSILKSVELPLGIKIEFQELKDVEDKAKKVGLVTHSVSAQLSSPYSFQTVVDEDPRLALAGLRIEIEKRLNDLLQKKGLHSYSKGITATIRQLVEFQVLSHEQSIVLLDLIVILNKAIHGAEVDKRASMWALEVGIPLLRSLEFRS